MEHRPPTSFRRLSFHVFVALLAGFGLSQCESSKTADRSAPGTSPVSEYGGVASRAGRFVSNSTAPAPPMDQRPGLGTTLGHEIHDGSRSTTFHRRSSSQPDALATFHYIDKEGARLMAEIHGRATKHGGDFELVAGKLKVTVSGRYSDGAFEYYEGGGRIFVVGTPGSTYEMKFENLTKARMEVVVSVDGLNVLDGQPASVRKSGYVIPAKSTITISGMKVNGKLRTLEFSSVADSRAAGEFGERGARNVGVIGVACFEEDETARRRARVEENYLRGDARAFGD